LRVVRRLSVGGDVRDLVVPADGLKERDTTYPKVESDSRFLLLATEQLLAM
jgi:hypothetical protein